MSKVRVLVADDSLTVRKRLVAALAADADCEVVGEAVDGRAAIELCEKLRPSVVTLDMMMPGVDGLAATEQIMAFCPTPIVIVSAAIRGDSLRAFEALAAGAVEVLEKPRDDEPLDAFDRRFVASVKLVSRIKVITHLRGRRHVAAAGPALPGLAEVALPAPPSSAGYRLIGMGASTGGPSALCAALGALPATFPLPVLLVLHLSPAFGGSFVEWIGSQISLPVVVAVDGEPLPAPGSPRVVMAPPDRHLVVRDGRLRLTLDPERHSCRPSVDALFESIAAELGSSAIGCLLTGMGRDGAQGLLAMKRAGAMTLAQDEATSIVFGMPREAARLGAASKILPLGAIVPALSDLARSGRRGGGPS
jgi:two-component system, chemotaxis family, protein-glutamate methylesterase/glutaminase